MKSEPARERRLNKICTLHSPAANTTVFHHFHRLVQGYRYIVQTVRIVLVHRKIECRRMKSLTFWRPIRMQSKSLYSSLCTFLLSSQPSIIVGSGLQRVYSVKYLLICHLVFHAPRDDLFRLFAWFDLSKKHVLRAQGPTYTCDSRERARINVELCTRFFNINSKTCPEKIYVNFD